MAAALQKRLQLERLDRDLYRSDDIAGPLKGRRPYGGQFIAHALMAASRTVANDLVVNSMHSHFLRPGDTGQPVFYYVKRLRTGKSFATRVVKAQQYGQVVFTAAVSFHRPENAGVKHSPPPPKVPRPEECTEEATVFREVLSRPEVGLQYKENIHRKMMTAESVSIRHCNKVSVRKPLRSGEPQYVWMKSNHPVTLPEGGAEQEGFKEDDGQMTEDCLHRGVASFMSDFTVSTAVLFPHGYPNVNTSMLVSLEHSIHFHKPFRVDEWFLYELRTPWADHNRGLCDGRVYTQNGDLVMTVQQEVLVRMKSGYRSTAKL